MFGYIQVCIIRVYVCVCVLCDIQMKVCVIQDECVIDIQSVCVVRFRVNVYERGVSLILYLSVWRCYDVVWVRGVQVCTGELLLEPMGKVHLIGGFLRGEVCAGT